MKTPEQEEYNLLAKFMPERKIEIKIPRVSNLFEKYEQDLGGFGINPLGSCQYHSAWVTYEFCRGLITEIGLPNFKALLGIPEFPLKPLNQLTKELELIIREYHDEMDPDEREDFGVVLPEEFTIKTFANFTRDNSWDLWSAYISFWSLFITPDGFDPNTYKIPISVGGVGPILNQLCQEENPIIGVSLALLEAIHPTEFDIEDWADYDT